MQWPIGMMVPSLENGGRTLNFVEDPVNKPWPKIGGVSTYVCAADLNWSILRQHASSFAAAEWTKEF